MISLHPNKLKVFCRLKGDFESLNLACKFSSYVHYECDAMLEVHALLFKSQIRGSNIQLLTCAWIFFTCYTIWKFALQILPPFLNKPLLCLLLC